MPMGLFVHGREKLGDFLFKGVEAIVLMKLKNFIYLARILTFYTLIYSIFNRKKGQKEKLKCRKNGIYLKAKCQALFYDPHYYKI